LIAHEVVCSRGTPAF